MADVELFTLSLATLGQREGASSKSNEELREESASRGHAAEEQEQRRRMRACMEQGDGDK